MRRLFFISILFVGLSSFASGNVAKEESSLSNMIALEQTTKVSLNSEAEGGFYRCRADITYEGEYVTSTYGFGATAAEACANARERATEFIAGL